jgi:hypothetical protein
MRKIVLIISICSIVIVGCSSESSPQYTYRQPEKINDGLDVDTLNDVNINLTLIASAVDDIKDGKYGEIHSLLIYKDGKLVFEEYFPGHDYAWDGPNFHGAWISWSRDKEHNVHSVGKSITSACIGIAIIFEYLPAYQHLNSVGKEKITIEHLLVMNSGLEWDEWGTSYSNETNDVIALWIDCDEPMACILEKPLVSEPGTEFTYSGGNTIVLGEIIKNATEMDIEEFCGKYLFAPLGIETPEWRWINDSGVVFAAADQKLTSREMLKLGVTYLNGGVWDGEQIVSEQWVEHSANPFPGPDNRWFNHFLRPIPPGDNTWGPRGYSYTWWTHEFSHAGKKIPAYWAFGWGGQKIVVFPDQDAVITFTGGNYTSADTTTKIITEYVIPAFE